MTFTPTDEQQAIIDAPLTPQCVVACPGSGKTATAVRRVASIRERMGPAKGFVTLLSYSNVAVETFRQEYKSLAASRGMSSGRVLIDTVDGFITTYVLRPHAGAVMRTTRAPYLVNGSETFLNSFKVWDGTHLRPISELRIDVDTTPAFVFSLQAEGRPLNRVAPDDAQRVIRSLGKTGAYTHELGRYWALKTLATTKGLIEAVCRRFPHIVVDEAQDIGSVHGTILELFAERGSTVSLIGDPNQGIFEFAGATGEFLRSYGQKDSVTPYSLTLNRRSVRSIVTVANFLAPEQSKTDRVTSDRKHGAFYIKYDENNLDALIATYTAILRATGYASNEAVVICRGKSTINKLRGGAASLGVGATSSFAKAAIARDRNADIASAFELASDGLLKLTQNPTTTLRRDLLDNAQGDTNARALRRLLWAFVRDPVQGLPSSEGQGKSQWLPLLKKNLTTLFSRIATETPFQRSPTWANNVTARDLDDGPLWKSDLAKADAIQIRIDTVHKVKGEGIPSVLYVAKTGDVNKLLDGTATEDGRIGYVAITRARDLILLAVPLTAKKHIFDRLKNVGFIEW